MPGFFIRELITIFIRVINTEARKPVQMAFLPLAVHKSCQKALIISG